MAILTFQELVLGVMAVGLNKDQNMQVSPAIFSAAARLSTDFLLKEIQRVYPYNQVVVDTAKPFIKRKLISVVDGIAVIPDDYSYIQSLSIAVNKEMNAGCADCDDEDDCHEKVFSRDEVQVEKDRTSVRKEKCYFQKVKILNLDEYDDATQNAFMPPSYKNPISMMVSRTQIKVCPYADISWMEMRYLKAPVKSEIGFVLMPDDTWQINTASPFHVELEWERNAYPQLFRCMCSLLGLHTRDGNFNDWSNALKQVGYF